MYRFARLDLILYCTAQTIMLHVVDWLIESMHRGMKHFQPCTMHDDTIPATCMVHVQCTMYISQPAASTRKELRKCTACVHHDVPFTSTSQP